MQHQPSRRQRYEEFLQTSEWQLQRREALRRWGSYCGCCGADNAVHVHHLNYRNLVDVTSDDLMPLCEKHHEMVHDNWELDQMARTYGDPIVKRRMVIAAIHRASQKTTVIKEVVQVRVPDPARTNAERKAAKRQRKFEQLRIQIAQRQLRLLKRAEKEIPVPQPQAPKEKPFKGWSILSHRYDYPVEGFKDMPVQTLQALRDCRAVPLWMKPDWWDEFYSLPESMRLILTMDHILAMRTESGGFTKASLGLFGLDYMHLPSGWANALVGRQVTAKLYCMARGGRLVPSNRAWMFNWSP